MTIEKQQRLLLRGIADLKSHANRAFASGLNQDFITFETSSREFKAFVRDHVTAPEIQAYAQTIETIRCRKTEPSILRIMFMPFVSLFSGRSVRARNYTIQDAKTVHSQYANLEFLVGMMEE